MVAFSLCLFFTGEEGGGGGGNSFTRLNLHVDWRGRGDGEAGFLLFSPHPCLSCVSVCVDILFFYETTKSAGLFCSSYLSVFLFFFSFFLFNKGGMRGEMLTMRRNRKRRRKEERDGADRNSY